MEGLDDVANGDGIADDPHEAAARAFVDRVRERLDAAIDTIVVFGSTVRDETASLASDVDVLVVLTERADRSECEVILRETAYDIMLEYGPVVELHVLDRPRFDELRERRNPFVRRAVSEGRSYG